ncbi:hypothetical protein LMG26685_04950 [Achromobacter mucicolens]|uniref:hypothetical protein n=1 Tax=Achromobacter mucicolens TaxID=1389922 RepID=UPI000B921C98|nr:hypothetical protein [Achromobacter mucicolens]OXC88632.1 hypothetical protein BMR85_022050 [Achromobacter sp. KAs 3-5]CAB3694100.1 hypothetical protein LMG26685_04950 [Achromobacter mucicolens]
MTTVIEHAWESLSNSLRLYVEAHMDFAALYEVDRPDAVTRQDRTLEGKLEKFHTLYDVTKDLHGFNYFKHADTALLIVLRNAIHHRDHDLFVSWEAFVLAHEETKKLPSSKYLFASLTPESERIVLRYYLPLDDFRKRLPDAKLKAADRATIGALWEQDLRFADITTVANREGFNIADVYVDVMPAVISAMHRVRGWLATTNFVPRGSDGSIYYSSFGAEPPVQQLSFRALVTPDN